MIGLRRGSSEKRADLIDPLHALFDASNDAALFGEWRAWYLVSP